MSLLRSISNRLSRMSIRYRLILYLLIGLLPLLFFSIYSFQQIYRVRFERVLLGHMATAQANAGSVREFIEGIVRAQEAISVIIEHQNMTNEEISDLLAAEQRAFPILEVLGFALPSGEIVAGQPSQVVGVNLGDREYFRQIVAGRDWAVSPLLIIRPTDTVGFVIAHRVESNGEFRGVVASAISPDALERFVTARIDPDIGYGILDSNGHIIVSTVLPEGLIQENRDRSWIPSIQSALRGAPAFAEPFYDRADGVERMGASVPVPGAGWVVNIFEPVETAMAPVRRALFEDLLLDFLIIIVLLILAWVVGTRLANPIISLAKKADAVAQGDFSQRMETWDQAELGTLAHAFNNMTVELKRSSQETLEREEFLKNLAELAEAVSSTLDPKIVLKEICGRSLELLDTDGAYIWVLEEDEDRLVGATACGFKAEEFAGMTLPITERETAAVQAIVKREGFYINNMPSSEDKSYILTQRFRTQSAIFQPLISAGKPLGVMMIVDTRDPNRFNDKALERAELLAGFAATALSNARDYVRERRIAETLQKGLLPKIPSTMGHFEIAHFYNPAKREAAIGGDFYDFIEVNDGHYGLVTGDVSGKGLEAAVITAMAKYVLRAYAADDPDPPVVLERTNNAIARYTEPELFITLVYGVLDTHTSKFRYGSAGHEPILIYRAKEKKVSYESPAGMAAGLVRDQEYLTSEHTLESGDMLMLYTDGLTDARSPDGEFLEQEGLEKLVLETVDGPASKFLRALMDQVNRYTGGEFADDVAILVVRRS